MVNHRTCVQCAPSCIRGNAGPPCFAMLASEGTISLMVTGIEIAPFAKHCNSGAMIVLWLVDLTGIRILKDDAHGVADTKIS